MRSAFLLLSLLIRAQPFEIQQMPNSKNHQDITRSAILRASEKACGKVAAYKKPAELNSKTLAEVCGHGTPENFEAAINIILFYNVMTDLNPKNFLSAKHHFDNEKFEEGRNRITAGIESIFQSINSNDFDTARKTLGKILHTLQDFYSHSNWIELNNSEPCEALINSQMPLPAFAKEDQPTCETDCENDKCGAKILKNIKILTSGYFGIKKPNGKCSHGGSFDLTTGRRRSWDGINKDYSDSSHGSDHEKAANVAIAASVQLLEKIRENIDKNVENNFLRLMGLHPTPPQGKWKPSFSILHFKSRYPEIKENIDDE